MQQGGTVMTSKFLRIAFLITGITLSSMYCAQTAPPVNPLSYLHDGIRINIRADSTLNRFEGKAHTLKLAVYQLTDNSGFVDLAKTADGINQLLKIEKFDPTVVGRDRLIIQPNENKSITIGRVENAKWVGIVAGYYQPAGGIPPNVLVEIPLIVKRKTIIRRMFESMGLLSQKDMRMVPFMEISVSLTDITMFKTGKEK